MTGTVDHVEVLANALDQAHTVITRVDVDRRGADTPCASWDVVALVDHLIADVGQFTTSAQGGEVDWTAKPAAVAPDDWADTFAAGSAELLAAWRRTGANPALEMQIAELAVHTWDLKQAIDEQVTLDPVIAEVGLAWMRGMLKDEHRGSEADGKSFGPEVTVPANAGSYERLVAFSGRTP